MAHSNLMHMSHIRPPHSLSHCTHTHTHTHPPPPIPSLPSHTRWLSLLDVVTDMSLSLLLLLYAIVHAYRAIYFMAAYIVATSVKQLLFSKITE